MFETLTVKTWPAMWKFSSIAGLFEESDLSFDPSSFGILGLWRLPNVICSAPAPTQQRAPSGALSGPDSAALRRTVWFCSGVGFAFLTVEVIEIEKKSDFSQHTYLCQWLAPCSVLEKLSENLGVCSNLT